MKKPTVVQTLKSKLKDVNKELSKLHKVKDKLDTELQEINQNQLRKKWLGRCFKRIALYDNEEENNKGENWFDYYLVTDVNSYGGLECEHFGTPKGIYVAGRGDVVFIKKYSMMVEKTIKNDTKMQEINREEYDRAKLALLPIMGIDIKFLNETMVEDEN